MRTDQTVDKEHAAARLNRRIVKLLLMASAALGEPEDPELVATRTWSREMNRAARKLKP